MELILTSTKPQSASNVERIIKAAATVVNWSKKSAEEGSMRNLVASEWRCKSICGLLMDLVHVSIMGGRCFNIMK